MEILQLMASRSRRVQAETFPAAGEGGPPRFYADLEKEEKDKLLKDRLKKYCQKVRTGLQSASKS